MKKFLPALGIVAVFAACNTNNSAAEQELAILKAKQATIDSMNLVVAEKEAIAEEKAVSYVAAASAAKKTSAARRTSSPRRATSQYASYSEPAVLPTAPVEQKKKGWSNKAKGAVIGGVVGAGAGAVISKEKKVQGAIIGGILGAAGGYGVGAILDKKNGR